MDVKELITVLFPMRYCKYGEGGIIYDYFPPVHILKIFKVYILTLLSHNIVYRVV